MLVEVTRLDSRIAGEIARGRFESEGIAAFLFDDGLASLGIGSLTPVRLMVEDRDEPRARALLASL